MASSTRTASPAFTAVPAAASILQILPGTEAVTSTLPAAPAGAAAFGAAGAAFGAGAAFAALTTELRLLWFLLLQLRYIHFRLR